MICYTSFISDTGNLCLLFFFVSLARGLSILLIFSRSSFLNWFFKLFLFSVLFILFFISFFSLFALGLFCSSFPSFFTCEFRLLNWDFSFLQFSSVAQSCLTLWDPMDCSMPGFPVQHQLPELAQTHVHWVGDAIQPSHPLSSPSPSAFNLSQHRGLFQWVSSLHHVAKVLELQLQHQFSQWIFRVNFL